MKKLLRMIGVELKRGMFTIPFLLSIAFMSCVIIYGAEQFLFHRSADRNCYFIFLTGIESEAVVFALPVIMALPYSGAFIDEITAGYIKAYLPRCGRKNYIRSKVIVSVLIPAICGISSLIIAFMISFSFCPNLKMIEGLPTFRDVFKESICYLLSSMFFGCLGSFYGAYFRSRYMAYAGTFITSYLLVILVSRYFTSLSFLNPRKWMSDVMMGPLLILLVVVILMTMLMFWIRLNEGRGRN